MLSQQRGQNAGGDYPVLESDGMSRIWESGATGCDIGTIKKPLDWGALAIAAISLCPTSAYGTTGSREPIIRNGAPAIIDTLKLGPSCGNGMIETPIFAAVNASRNVCMSAPASGGRTIPNNILLAGLNDPGATFHPALWRICEICIAKKSASGSPSVHRRFTAPGLAESTFPRFVACVSERVRHATTAFSFSVSNRALAASFSNVAARSNASPAVFPAAIPCVLASATLASTPSLYLLNSISASSAAAFCSFIITNCETPTAIAAAVAIARKPIWTEFQPSKPIPHIGFTLFEGIALSVCALSIVGLLSIAGAFFARCIRNL